MPLAGKMDSGFRFGAAADRKLRLETGTPPAGRPSSAQETVTEGSAASQSTRVVVVDPVDINLPRNMVRPRRTASKTRRNGAGSLMGLVYKAFMCPLGRGTFPDGLLLLMSRQLSQVPLSSVPLSGSLNPYVPLVSNPFYVANNGRME